MTFRLFVANPIGPQGYELDAFSEEDGKRSGMCYAGLRFLDDIDHLSLVIGGRCQKPDARWWALFVARYWS
jgi:hypothetical protein